MNKEKVIIDPVQGFIKIPDSRVYDIFMHPYVQRLSRIRQLGLSFLVYPGATHTRFLHSIGAMHLASHALTVLKERGVDISVKEFDALAVAVLLHDIGHGPFSHVLEHTLVKNITHEDISLLMMKQIQVYLKQHSNDEAVEVMSDAIAVFTNTYNRPFFHQLVSSQLDVDRLDYLQRDAFFCGVQEGTVGCERIISMLGIEKDNIVFDAKATYSIEKFLLARRFMYLQVYLHKTSVAAEQMLIKILQRAKWLAQSNVDVPCSPSLRHFIYNDLTDKEFYLDSEALRHYALLDDNDILVAVKTWSQHDDKILRILSHGFINRYLFKALALKHPDEPETIKELNQLYAQKLGIRADEAHYFYSDVRLSADAYSAKLPPIMIRHKDGTLQELSDESEIFNINTLTHHTNQWYRCAFSLTE